jgi:AcrR family transcriptional regulator
MTAKPNSRELAKQETRDALIRAGMAAFVEEGVDLPSLDAICARAGFTRGAFYVHFKDRDDFFNAVADQALRDFVRWVLSTDQAPGDLRGVVERFLSALTQGKKLPDPHKLLMQIAARGSQRSARDGAADAPYGALIRGAIERMAQVSAEGQRAGEIKRDLPPDQLGMLLVASAVGFIVLFGGGLDPNVDDMRALAARWLFTDASSDPALQPGRVDRT